MTQSTQANDNALNLYYEGRLVGHLVSDAGSTQFQFHYQADWQASGFALSPQLPLDGNLTAQDATYFFQNLLPEGQNLEEISRALHLSKTAKFEILKQIGADASGAFVLAPSLEGEDAIADRRLTHQALSKRLALRERRNFAVWDQKVRVSVAGFQDKIGIKVVGDEWFLPEGLRNHTSHLLKPPPVNVQFESMVVNEAFCMQLSRRIGLPTAETEIVQVPEPVLLVKRFDRSLQANGLYQKRHVIDGCQLLGLPPNFKMERPYGSTGEVAAIREGASIAKLAEAIRQNSSAPLVDIKWFVEWIAFQLCIGNVDAHAKNLSFLVDAKGKIRLAPFYDQVCILDFGQLEERLNQADGAVASNLDHDLAMAIGDEFDARHVQAYDIALMAQESNIPVRAVITAFQRVINAVLNALDKVQLEDSYQRFDAIRNLIKQQTQHLQHQLPQVEQAFKDL